MNHPDIRFLAQHNVGTVAIDPAGVYALVIVMRTDAHFLAGPDFGRPEFVVNPATRTHFKNNSAAS